MARQGLDSSKIEGFDWDSLNIDKNWMKHKVYYKEAEQIFFNEPFDIRLDEKHSQVEDRFVILGVTDKGRKISAIFTLRNNKIRVISARTQDRKERRIYEKIKTDTKVQK